MLASADCADYADDLLGRTPTIFLRGSVAGLTYQPSVIGATACR
jgi:hypothetical protein